MSKAIGIKLKKVESGYDLGASKFFGTPTLPRNWQDDFYDDEIFFFQIRLSDIAELDTQNLLPNTGYLYAFLHTENGKYNLTANVKYSNEEPELALEDFNLAVEGYEDFDTAWLMEFYETEEDEICTRLFGRPSDWNYEGKPPKLLLQFDPLDNDVKFLDDIDGFLYIFFGEDNNLNSAFLHLEYS